MNTIFQVLSLAWSLESGALPGLTIADTETDYFKSSNAYYLEASFELQLPILSWQKADRDGLYLGASFNNVFMASGISFATVPIEDTYKVKGGFRWDGVTLGFEHECMHPVATDAKGKVLMQYVFGGYDKVFVKLEGRL